MRDVCDVEPAAHAMMHRTESRVCMRAVCDVEPAAHAMSIAVHVLMSTLAYAEHTQNASTVVVCLAFVCTRVSSKFWDTCVPGACLLSLTLRMCMGDVCDVEPAAHAMNIAVRVLMLL